MVRARYLSAFLALLTLLLSASFAFADPPSSEVSKMFPASLGTFHQIKPPRQLTPLVRGASDADQPNEPLQVAGVADYAAADGEILRLTVTRYENDSAAYASLTGWRKYQRERAQGAEVRVENVGTADGVISTEGLAFFKGPTFVFVTIENGKNPDQAIAFARLFSATLDSGEGDIPVLVKHLPNWETAQRDALYAVSQGWLLSAIPGQPILKEVSFEGGTEAVTANYGQAQLVIVEFTTPQFSIENDQRVAAKIQELKSAGQLVPSAYRRVGNYSVFVFNAADEKTANELIDSVKYEKVVQWLGEDPHLYERFQRYLAQTSAGVLAAVLKGSGLSLLICVGAGGLFGALLFRRRRAQQAAAYSDAGGAIRLNLDEMTGTSNSHRLLGAGKQTESDSTRS